MKIRTRGVFMFRGSIVFSVADSKQKVDLDFGDDIKPTKIVSKGSYVAAGKTAPYNVWLYRTNFDNDDEFAALLNRVVALLSEKKSYVRELSKIYEYVRLSIDVESEYGQVGFSIPPDIVSQIAELGCELEVDIISGGMVE